MAATLTSGNRRILRDLLAGVGLGVVVVALVWQFYPGFWKEPGNAARVAALQQRDVLRARALRQEPTALAVVEPPASAVSPCELDPLIPAVGSGDGHGSLEHPFPAGPRARAKVFLRAAHAAAAQGRPRDVEIALIAACRENLKAAPVATVPVARVQQMLAEHYLSAAQASLGPREPLRERARALLARSVATYARTLGPQAARTREVRARLAAMEADPTADLQAGTATAVDVARTQAVAVRAGPVQPRTVARSPTMGVGLPGTSGPAARRPLQPANADAAGAIVSNADLQQQAADLARLQAQAEAVSDDPAGLQARTEAARLRRDRCRDVDCLSAWFAARRRELIGEF